MNEVRRYYTYLRKTFRAKYQKIVDHNGNKVKNKNSFINNEIAGNEFCFNAKCVDCDKPIKKSFEPTFRDGLLEITEICSHCFTRNFFDIINIIPEFSFHFQRIKLKIKKSKKIIFLGIGKINEDLLFYDLLGLDYSKIVCLVDERTELEEAKGVEEKSGSKDKYFFDQKRVYKEELAKLDYDLVLVGNLIPEQLNTFFPKHELNKIEFINPLIDKNKLTGPIEISDNYENKNNFLNLFLSKIKI